MRTTIAIATFLAVGAGAAGVSANLLGSDTLKEVTIDLLNLATADCGGVAQNGGAGTLIYDGTGSGNGQAAVISATQQIAPMSRAFNNGANICKLPVSGTVGAPTQGTGEGIVFALDGLTIAANAANWGTCNGAVDPTCTPQLGLGMVNNKVITPDASRTCTVDADCNTAGIFGEACTAGVCTYTIPTWKEALRIIYAGMSVPTTDATNRNQLAFRNCGSPERKFLAANWNQLFQSCASANCPNGVQHAFRRNDESGTSDVFVTLLQLPSISQTNNTTPFCNASTVGPKFFVNPLPLPCTTDPDCGSGAPAGTCTGGTCKLTCVQTSAQGPADANSGAFFNPAATPVTAPPGGNLDIAPPTFILESVGQATASNNKYTGNAFVDLQDADVIRRTCPNNVEDVCSARGDLGLVLPVWDVSDIGADAFPTVACATGVFSCFGATRSNVGPAAGATFATCADGANPNLTTNLCPKGQCAFPVARVGTTLDPRCVNGRNNNPSADIPPGTKFDGRAYNLTTWTSDPSAGFVKAKVTRSTGLFNPPCGITTTAPVEMSGAFYRIHSVHSGKNTGTTPNLCKQGSATDQIGCLVQASPCSLGYAGNEAASIAVNGVTDVLALKVNGLDPADLCVRNLLVNPTGSTTYPLSRKLYLNTLKGFENVSGDELKLAGCFAKRSVVDPIVTARGFVTLSPVASTRPTFCEDFPEPTTCPTTPAAANVDACKAVTNPSPIPSCELSDPIATCPGL